MSYSLGIRTNGLNMISYNVILWAGVVPTLSFGRKLWILTDKVKENVMFAKLRRNMFSENSAEIT